jgi:molybdate transport system substrate-binding protein
MFLHLFVTLAVLIAAPPAHAQEGRAQEGRVHVAVAANFTDAAKEIAAAFKVATGRAAVLSFGSTGQLYSQITLGAPFEVFLSADDLRPAMLEKDGLAVANTRFTYAIGKLVLWSADPNLVTGPETLKAGRFSKIALANPAAAPYGVAALETLKALNVHDALASRIVQGNSIAQTFQFIDTRNAELGFIALAQLGDRPGGSRWIVPSSFHTEIRQDAVLLSRGAASAAARSFVDFLRGPEARKLIERYGYDVRGVS